MTGIVNAGEASLLTDKHPECERRLCGFRAQVSVTYLLPVCLFSSDPRAIEVKLMQEEKTCCSSL